MPSRNFDPFLLLLMLSNVPIICQYSMSFWIGQNLTIIPKHWSENKVSVFTWILIALMSITGSMIYLSYSSRAIWFAPILSAIGFIVLKIMMNYFSKLLFDEHYD